MGHSQSSRKPRKIPSRSKPRWREVPSVHANHSGFPTLKEWQQFLYSMDVFANLGKDVCGIIASFLESVCEEGIVTANGYINHPKLRTPLRFLPPFVVSASCICPLPPIHIAFGTTLPGEHRAAISVYNVHTLLHEYNLLFPVQSASDFVAPSPSVSSMLLVPSEARTTSPFDASPCLAALDELGNLFIWRVRTQQLLYTFNTKSPVFYSFSTLSLMPLSRLGLLLSGTPGPSQPSSRLVVFDLVTGETFKCSVDTLNSGVAFPVTFFIPNNSSQVGTTPNRDPYCLYTDHSLCKWRMMYETPELVLARSDWQWFNMREWRGDANRQWKYKYRSERILSTSSGIILRVEGTLQSVRVWIGSHVDRNFWAYFEYPHAFEVKEDIREPHHGSRLDAESRDFIYRHRHTRRLGGHSSGEDSASPRTCGYSLHHLNRHLSLDDADTLSESEPERKLNDDEKHDGNVNLDSPNLLTSSTPTLSPLTFSLDSTTDEETPRLETTSQAATPPQIIASITIESLRLRRRARQRRLPRPPCLQVSATFLNDKKISIASAANNGTKLIRVYELISVESYQHQESDIEFTKEEGCLRARCTYSKSFLSDPHRDHSILTQNSAPRIGLRQKDPFKLW